jgi:hypothetical protein
MVVSPTLRGLFGLEWNAETNTLTVTPNLPASWNEAEVHHVPLGSAVVDLVMRRVGVKLEVRSTGGGKTFRLATRRSGSNTEGGILQIPLPAVEAGIPHGLPDPGSTTSQMKVLDQQTSAHSLTLRLAAPADSRQILLLRVNDPRITVRSNDITLPDSHDPLRQLQVIFPQGAGYVEKTVVFSW